MFRYECEFCHWEYGYLGDQSPTHKVICPNPKCGKELKFKRRVEKNDKLKSKPVELKSEPDLPKKKRGRPRKEEGSTPHKLKTDLNLNSSAKSIQNKKTNPRKPR